MELLAIIVITIIIGFGSLIDVLSAFETHYKKSIRPWLEKKFPHHTRRWP
jgi:hypothetical protein